MNVNTLTSANGCTNVNPPLVITANNTKKFKYHIPTKFTVCHPKTELSAFSVRRNLRKPHTQGLRLLLARQQTNVTAPCVHWQRFAEGTSGSNHNSRTVHQKQSISQAAISVRSSFSVPHLLGHNVNYHAAQQA